MPGQPNQQQLAATLHKAVAEHRAGQLDSAERLYRQVLKQVPQHPDALHLLGLTLHQRGNSKGALKPLRKAAASQPGNPQFQRSLGLAERAAGNLDAAIAAFRRAVAAKPDFLAALANLGAALGQAGQHEQAEGLQRRALSIDNSPAGLHLDLGTTLLALGRSEEAAAAFDAALEREPENTDALLGRLQATPSDDFETSEALLLRVLRIDPAQPDACLRLGELRLEEGEFTTARDLLRRAAEQRPQWGAPYFSYAQGKRFEPGDPLLAQMDRQWNDPRLAPLDRAYLGFARGKAFDDLGDYDRAFAAFREANDILAEREPYDAAEMERLVDDLRRVFTPEFLAKSVREMSSAEAPTAVFIVGMARSGTTLAERILAAHPQVHACGERLDMPSFANEIGARADLPGPYPEAVRHLRPEHRKSLADRYLAGGLAGAPADVTAITDKLPANAFHLGLVALLFPNARIVHLRRNPLDVCLSNYFQFFGEGGAYSWTLARLGHYYTQYDRLLTWWREALPLTIHDVGYEDLTSNPEPAIRALVEHCGLPWNDACLDHTAGSTAIRTASKWQARQKIYRGSVGRWRNYEAHLEPLCEALGDVLGNEP